MPPTSRPTDHATRFRRLVRRLQTIEEELISRGETLLGLAIQLPDARLSPRTASLLRRMDVIDAELVAIEALLPQDFLEMEDGSDPSQLNDFDIGSGPFNLGSG